MEQMTIEQRVAAAILQKATDSIEIDGKVYPIADPSIATLILVSEIISTLPVVDKVPKEQVVYAALHHAKDFGKLGDLCAILILGANNLTEETEKPRRRGVFGLFSGKKVEVVDKQAELAELIMQNVRPSVMFDCLIRRLQDMEIASFFAIITSLSEANVLNPTREVED